ncbi:apolipoprotein A-II [Lacerta agilis]|uniref:apolipoprotein A-II n=1 Tax=Lacerta agilis TaxID=80427 RepID=UPI0014193B08|nr:apolipoprotein A-II [Lacerta agilis]
MKVFALAILLISVCCMEGTVVRRQAEQAPAPASDVVQQVQGYISSISEYFKKDLVPQEKLEEFKAQTLAYVQQAQEQMTPVAEQIREQATQFFSNLLNTFQKKTE